ncbi:MAG: caspase family protein [Deltaproteobacteria bacterium]|nr:caspase family protein [Deltaproteobacteria bacterium]
MPTDRQPSVPLVWNPARTLVFAAGLTEFAHPAFPSFDKASRLDDAFVATLRARGVALDRLRIFLDAAATRRTLEHAFAAHVARAVASDTLIFYFCGHGTRDDHGNGYLVPYDGGRAHATQWAARAIVDTVATRFRGFAVIFLIDACYSGAFGKALAQRPPSVPWACLTAAMATRPTTAASYFSASLIDAFAGRRWVDLDGDGSVLLEELAEHIADELAFTVGQLCSFAASDDRLRRLRLATATTPKPDPAIGRRVIARDRFGAWAKARIEDTRADRLLVHFVGMSRTWDEWVAPEGVRAWAPVRYRPGTAVQGKGEGGRWRRGTVLRELRGVHLVRFDRSGTEEWLAPERLRPA